MIGVHFSDTDFIDSGTGECETAVVVRICITGNTVLVSCQDLNDNSNKYSLS